MGEDLKPCPFCGQRPEQIGSRAVCNGIMPDGKDVHSTISMARSEWNTRADEQP